MTCPGGEETNPDNDGCKICDAEQKPNTNKNGCEACDNGKYSNSASGNVCKTCDAK
jgi:hypothetical protein